jgi:hypothetical protein
VSGPGGGGGATTPVARGSVTGALAPPVGAEGPGCSSVGRSAAERIGPGAIREIRACAVHPGPQLAAAASAMATPNASALA